MQSTETAEIERCQLRSSCPASCSSGLSTHCRSGDRERSSLRRLGQEPKPSQNSALMPVTSFTNGGLYALSARNVTLQSTPGNVHHQPHESLSELDTWLEKSVRVNMRHRLWPAGLARKLTVASVSDPYKLPQAKESKSPRVTISMLECLVRGPSPRCSQARSR